MLLTFVQLHILLVAAPAFANWALLCPAALGNVPAPVVVLACRNALEAAPTAIERHSVTMRQSPSALSWTAGGQIAASEDRTFFAAPRPMALNSAASFPHAPRAP